MYIPTDLPNVHKDVRDDTDAEENSKGLLRRLKIVQGHLYLDL